jgi:serine protease Do
MTALRFTLLLGVLFGCAAHADTTLDERARINQASLAVYRVHATYGEDRGGSGSAIHLGGGRFATSCHVTRDAKGVRISRGATMWQAYYQHKNVERDLCIVMTHEVPPHAAQLAEPGSVRVGQRVYSAGYPAALSGLNIQYGTVRALYDFDGGRIIRTAAFFARGESGGALFNEEGKVVGVLAFKSRVGADHNFAVPADWIGEVEQRAKDKPSPEDAVAFWEGPFEGPVRFLDAAALEADDAWEALLQLAQDWARSAPNDPEAALALSKALYHTARERDALEPARKALALDPRHAEAWFQLALIYKKLNDQAELGKAVAKLTQLSRDRVEDLDITPAPARAADCKDAASGC